MKGRPTRGVRVEAPARRQRVLLVDPFPIVRLALSEWINRTPDLIVCGAADNEASARAAVKQLKPDLVVTEILCQQDLGLIRNLHQDSPQLPILVFSFRDEGWYAPRALEAGADGYLMKGVSIEELVNGIREALKGRIVLSPGIRGQLLQKCLRRHRNPQRLGNHRGDYSPFE